MATAEDVWQLLAELTQAQKETNRELQEARLENERKLQEARLENERKLQEARSENERELKEARSENERKLQEARSENERKLQEARSENERELKEARLELDRQLQEARRENDRELKEARLETEREFRQLNQQVKELGKQIGGLGKKFGSFTEGLALPSMDRILRERFGMETVSPRVRVRKDGQEIEIDVLAYANGDRKVAYVVEVKSHPRSEAIEQFKTLLQRFPHFFPEHQDKELYGILAAVDLSAKLRQEILAEGLYVARIEEDVFALDVPEDFEPKAW